MYDVVTLGEILIDFSPDGTDARGYRKYIQNPGGAIANVAAVFAKYGARVGLIGKVGEDMFGHYLYQYFSGLGVDCSGMVFDSEYNTTLAFVSLDDKGDRDFAFYRKNEADIRLTVDEMNREMLQNTKIFHFGSLSLTADPARTATYQAIEWAKASGALISYDPNYRESLWTGQDAPTFMKSVLGSVDFIKVSEEEGEMLTGCSQPEKCVEALLKQGIKFVAITMGSKGAYYASEREARYVEAYKVNTIDTTGAGDVFWGTLLHEYIKTSFDTAELVHRAAVRAAKAAALCTTKKGGASSIPMYSEI